MNNIRGSWLASAVSCFALVLGLAILFRLRLATPLGPNDDAYMTWRGSSNLASGLGFLYNPGEFVLPTSSPLYAILLALLSSLSGLAPDVFYLPLALLLDSVTLFLLWAVLRKAFPKSILPAGFTLCLSLNYVWALSSRQGMESPLYLFLIALAVWGLATTRHSLAAFVSGLVAVTRPEGMCFAGLFAVAILFLEKKYARCLIWLVLPIAVWCIFSFFYYGSVIPTSLLAKNKAYVREGGSALHWSLLYLSQSIAYPISDWRLTSLPLLALLCWFGLKELSRLPLSLVVLVVFSVSIFTGYALFNPLMFSWYALSLIPGIVLLWFLGVRHFEQRFWGNGRAARGIISALYFLPCSILLFYHLTPGTIPWLSILTSDEVHNLKKDEHLRSGELMALGTERREKLYAEIAKEIHENFPADVTILAPEFGALGYGNTLHIISSLGHVNPEVFPFLPVPSHYLRNGLSNAVSLEQIKHFRPGLIVSMNRFIEVVAEDPWFNAHYRLRRREAGWMFADEPILVFERRELDSG